MFNEKHNFVFATPAAIGAMLFFINTTPANINSFSDCFQSVVCFDNIIAMPKVKTHSGNNRFYYIDIRITIKSVFGLDIFGIRPKDCIFASGNNMFPGVNVCRVAKIAACMDPANSDTVRINLRDNGPDHKIKVIPGKIRFARIRIDNVRKRVTAADRVTLFAGARARS
jgi:hypothetical protein